MLYVARFILHDDDSQLQKEKDGQMTDGLGFPPIFDDWPLAEKLCPTYLIPLPAVLLFKKG